VGRNSAGKTGPKLMMNSIRTHVYTKMKSHGTDPMMNRPSYRTARVPSESSACVPGFATVPETNYGVQE
jgi:hypothetical protein